MPHGADPTGPLPDGPSRATDGAPPGCGRRRDPTAPRPGGQAYRDGDRRAGYRYP